MRIQSKMMNNFFLFFVVLFMSCSKKTSTNLLYLDYKINETSGLIRWFGDTLITHNDSGNDAVLYFLRADNGEIVKEFDLPFVMQDFEEIKRKEETLILADIGNNEGERTDLNFKFIDRKGNLTNQVNFSYAFQMDFNPDTLGLYDAEAFITWQDELLLFSKNRSNYNSYVYRINTGLNNQEVSPVDTLRTNFLVTGACYEENDSTLLIVGYDFSRNHFIQRYTINGDLTFNLVKQVELEFKQPLQIESIEIIGEYIYLTSEAESKKLKPLLIKIKKWKIYH